MTFPRSLRSLSPGLTLGLAFMLWLGVSSTSPAPAQSGGGTGGAGGSAPASSGGGGQAGTGAAPGALPGNSQPASGGRQVRPPAGPTPRSQPGDIIDPGPGITVTFPGENINPLMPIEDLIAGYQGVKLNELAEVTELQLNFARRIPAPGDRSLALSRIASAATFSNQLDLAETALIEASRAALQMTPGMVQDQRLMSIIVALIGLSEARLREGKPDAAALPMAGVPPSTPAPLPNKPPPATMIRLAETDFRRAAYLAERISNPTYRSEMMYRVAENMGYASQSIVNEYPRGESGSDKDSRGMDQSYEGLPDRFLQEAADIAARIERPVWHDQGLVRVATAAAESKQFSRALTVARMIPQPEVRANALLKIAEIQARRGDASGATATYYEAALAVASIVQDDPRAVLAGVLIDNLVTVGRFEDARKAVLLYPDDQRRIVAYGAIAEAMGYRGAAVSALQWINREIPPANRSFLYRKVNNGVVAAIQSNRSKDMSNRER